ncbi:MAG: uroporphyrinogen decarboxylase [Deltaproteobacteria bacterium RIFOXYA12_FULL_58_15]|nr:MAG: uroporphyrinogen decarboxylase [Deltaproteobacteria bacterium RIFOXYA12_FULL_58_15]
MSETLFAKACRGVPVDSVPVWLMRQAGRYMPEYQRLRDKGDFLTICQDPALASQATLEAVEYLGVDAAIIFSDIMLPAAAMGLNLEFSPGPRIEPAVQSDAAVRSLKTIDPERDLGFVLEAIRRTRSALPTDKSLIGFVGAPLTLSGYMVEGAPTPLWLRLKGMLSATPDRAHAMLARVADAVAAHAAAQVKAGCDAIQLFDTTAGDLAEEHLIEFAFRYARDVIEQLKPLGVPIIYFARRIGAHLDLAADLGADVLGLDWTVSVANARRIVGDRVALMGNLDPAVLLTDEQTIESEVIRILGEADGMNGFVFNLGHGVLPATPPAHARHLVEVVHAHGRRP